MQIFPEIQQKSLKTKIMKHYFKEVEESLLIPGLDTHSEDFFFFFLKLL